MIERLKTLQANRVQFTNPDELYSSLKSDSTLRNEIEVLSKVFFHKSVSGCSNCYFDAYIQLISLKIDIAMEKLKCAFLLLAGALLHDVVNYDNDLLCSNANITDDLALYHLKTNPNCRNLFQTLPDNVDELIEAYVIPEKVEEVSSTVTADAQEEVTPIVPASPVVDEVPAAPVVDAAPATQVSVEESPEESAQIETPVAQQIPSL